MDRIDSKEDVKLYAQIFEMASKLSKAMQLDGKKVQLRVNEILSNPEETVNYLKQELGEQGFEAMAVFTKMLISERRELLAKLFVEEIVKQSEIAKFVRDTVSPQETINPFFLLLLSLYSVVLEISRQLK